MTFPWPDAETLAAGDEELEREPYPAMDTWIPTIDRRASSDDDGHLEWDDWIARHPDQEA